MKKIMPLLLILSLLLMTLPTAVAAAETVEDPYEAFLRLGKPIPGVDQIVGGVQVWNDAETLYVQFETIEPFCIMALHLQVANDLSDRPDVSGMTLPEPAINESYDDCLAVRGPFEFDLSDNGWNNGSYLVINAHADIGIVECTLDCVTITPAPYGAFVVTDYDQGLRKDGTPVTEIRSDPDSVLIWDDEQLPDAFFSLGLGGWIEVEFENPMANGDGDDVLVVEDTWGPYVDETADVYASNDGETWVFLGTADNETRDLEHPWQTVSSFDLGSLTDARYIRIVDTTPVETMPPEGDGYDLNSIQALQDYVECTETCVTECGGRAWAGNKIGPGAAWSRWFRYSVVLECEVQQESVLIPAQQVPGQQAPGQQAPVVDAVISVPDQQNDMGAALSPNEGAAIQQAQKGR